MIFGSCCFFKFCDRELSGNHLRGLRRIFSDSSLSLHLPFSCQHSSNTSGSSLVHGFQTFFPAPFGSPVFMKSVQ